MSYKYDRRTAKDHRYDSLLDEIMSNLMSVDKTIERAHEVAPAGASKAVLVGLHQDLFQMTHEFRTYIRQLKQLE